MTWRRNRFPCERRDRKSESAWDIECPPEIARDHRGEEFALWLDRSTRRAANHVLHKYTRGAVIGFLILICTTAILFALANNQRTDLRRATTKVERDAATIDNLRQALNLACERVNVVRAQSNLSNSVSFDILSGAIRRPGVDPQIVKSYPAEVTKLKVTKLTDCVRAVDTFPRSHYRYPRPVLIGNPVTGKIAPGVPAILRQSIRRLEHPDSARTPPLKEGVASAGP